MFFSFKLISGNDSSTFLSEPIEAVIVSTTLIIINKVAVKAVSLDNKLADLYLYVFLNQELNQLIIWLKASIFKEAPPIKAPSTELMLQICLELIELTEPP